MASEAAGVEMDQPALQAALRTIATDGIVRVRNSRVSPEQLHALLSAASASAGLWRYEIRGADFTGTTFTGRADFRKTVFRGNAKFVDARFDGPALFDEAVFEKAPTFIDATFRHDASFGKADFGFGETSFASTRFERKAYFGDAHFRGEVGFEFATFGEDASFRKVAFARAARFSYSAFRRSAHFGGATFHFIGAFGSVEFGGNAGFRAATFCHDAYFQSAVFHHDAYFLEAVFGHNAMFDGIRAEHAKEFGALIVFEKLQLDHATFGAPVRLEISAREVSVNGATFPAGTDLLVRWAQVTFDGADFGEQSLLSEPRIGLDWDGSPAHLGWEEPLDDGAWLCRRGDPPGGCNPSVESARQSKLSKLTLSNVDARACRFTGAHGLDALRLERVEFAQPPSFWRVSRRWPHWTRRQVIAEEHHWRAASGHGPGWHPQPMQPTPSVSLAPSAREADEVEGIYRSLRKAREDAKDEPGAADFYYGEMEMRRHAAPLAERVILTAYWAFSGYGLRASRAMAALLLTVLVLGGALYLVGIASVDGSNPSLARSLFYSLESTTSFFRVPDSPNVTLTYAGEAIQIVLRLLGPLFVGLTLLSVRGRVKR